MTRDEVLKMAEEAGGIQWGWESIEDAAPMFERFAALVAAKERGRFALECIDLVALHGGSVEIEAAIRARSPQ